MKSTTKLILVAVAITGLAVAGHGLLRARRVSERSLSHLRRDLAAQALAIGTAADQVWRAAGPEAASRLVGGLDPSRRPGAGADAVRLRMQRSAAIRGDGALTAAAFAGLSSEAQAACVERRAGSLHIELAVGSDGLLQLRQTLASEPGPDGGGARGAWVGLLALLGGGLLLAGVRLVDPRLQLLTAQARALADGDYAARTEAGQEDEIGLLAREMNRLGARLAEAAERERRERRARTATLERLRQADRLSTVSKLASSMAHDLGTPLNVVSGRAMMIMSAPGCPPEIAADARIIGEQASNMTGIIRRMLDHARRRDLQRTSVSVRDLVQRAVDLVEPLAEAQGVAIEQTGPDQLVASVDENKLLQVLTNLMINGIQAMPEGGRLRLQSAALEVEEPPDSRAAAGTYIRISVEDNGVGIDASALEAIFEPFFSIKGSGGSMGLGLPVCHGIIRDHGGWVEAHSLPGQGSRFDVYVPQGHEIEGDNR